MADLGAVKSLENGRARVEQGWIQGFMQQPIFKVEGHWWNRKHTVTMGYCVLGSIQHERATFRAQDYFTRAIGGNNIAAWNDAKGRTKEEVLEAFDKAIAIANVAPDPAGSINRSFSFTSVKIDFVEPEPPKPVDVVKEVKEYVNSLPESEVGLFV